MAPEWSIQSIQEHGTLFDDRIYFEGVFTILPGRCIISQGFGQVEHGRYWDSCYPDKASQLDQRQDYSIEDEMVAGVQQRLMNAVRLRMQADVPVGVYLSGGIDSSAIAGLVKNIMDERIQSGGADCEQSSRLKCFTVQFDEGSGADESDIARRTAQWLDAELHVVHVTEELLASRFEETIWFGETVFPELTGVCKLHLAQLAKSQGIRAVITGEGSDEHFGGYPMFRADMIEEKDHSWPASYFPSDQDIKQSVYRAFDGWGFKDLGALDSSSTLCMLQNTQIIHGFAKATLPPLTLWANSLPVSDPHAVLAERLPQDGTARKWHSLHTTQYLWLQSILPVIILRIIGDNIDMVHQVESRPAFLDHHVTEYVNGIPPSLKMKYDPDTGSFNEKYILRQAMKPFITDELYKRRKHPFITPMNWKAGGPLENLFRNLITQHNVTQLGFVDWDQANWALNNAFGKENPTAFKSAMVVAQFVVLMQRFQVKPAIPCPN
ncbi:hypothetical protein BO71DRAFT_456709 [Aspergillus ellipticus CBS 707.79]|uniref:asparagine synthase (glutamine-hydrolyzing) n=1 Tax=Aspergillus ellipticus CBS 707.79 TaxID=1448320 RepID=A0A319D630_9EURO|nr:hypothetical protein BO71DRAFT_456709 [Aspergillus ellipticus CBS 707.79]